MEDDSVLVKIKPETFDHEVKYYVPVYQVNFEDDGSPMFSPTFQYNMGEATTDEQMAWALGADWVMELTGHFKATTKPFIVKGYEDESNISRF